MGAPLETGEMRAVCYVGQGESRLAEIPIPDPAEGEILLRLRCCGLCGTDLFKLDHDSIPQGTVLGHELVGSVARLGSGVSSFELGQRVVVPHHVACGECSLCQRGSETLCSTFKENLLSPGGFSDFILVGKRAVKRAARILPASMPDAAAIFMEPAACVLRGIDKAGLADVKTPSTVSTTAIVLGCGSMGLLHLLVLRALHPGIRVAMSDPIPERREIAKALGADTASSPETLTRAAGHLSEGIGVDAVFDTVGQPSVTAEALPLTREGGSLVLFAHARPGARLALESNQIFKHERRLVGTYSGSLHEQRRIFALLSSGRLDPTPLVSHRLPLQNFQRAVELASQQKALKILLTPGQGGDAHGAS
jgi:L-iditol 2-dehydrogenase